MELSSITLGVLESRVSSKLIFFSATFLLVDEPDDFREEADFDLFLDLGGLPGPLLGPVFGLRAFFLLGGASSGTGFFRGLPRLRGEEDEGGVCGCGGDGVLLFGGRPRLRGGSMSSGSGCFLGRPGPRFTGGGASGCSSETSLCLGEVDFLLDVRVPVLGEIFDPLVATLGLRAALPFFSASLQLGQNQLFVGTDFKGGVKQNV